MIVSLSSNQQKTSVHQALSCACIALLSAALEMGTYAVNAMRSMFHQQLMMYSKVTFRKHQWQHMLH